MKKKSNAYFVLPVFNEALNIPQLLVDMVLLDEMVRESADQVTFLVIDDGSTDDTVRLLETTLRKNLKILRHVKNQGPGAAFQTAFDYLLKNQLNSEDLVITLEGDATSEPQFFARMLKRLDEGDDLVLASPYLYGGGFSHVETHRLILSHLANFLFKLILNIHGLATFSCFYRIYRGRALIKLQQAYGDPIVASSGFDCAAEIIVKAVRSGLLISEVPFQVNWSRRKGTSKMRIGRTSFAYLNLFYKYRKCQPVKSGVSL